MSNLGYCRFENTYNDLCDCIEHLFDDLSESEEQYRDRLVKLCRTIVDDCGGMEDE